MVAVPRRGASCYGDIRYEDLVCKNCCPPQGRELLPDIVRQTSNLEKLLSPAGARVVTRNIWTSERKPLVAVPRRGASCYMSLVSRSSTLDRVAVPRRGASCYTNTGDQSAATNTLLSPAGARVVTIFCLMVNSALSYCPPQGREVLLYCYYNTRFAPNQPVSKPSSIATGCKTQRHKL